MREAHSFAGAFLRSEDPSPYRYLPFRVPAGARRIEVSYHHEYNEGEDGFVDLGLFDSRGIDFLAGGFRGWSGGARRTVYVATNDATPGYVRGPLPAGEWNVILGWPVRGPETARYWVELNVDSDPASDGDVAPAASMPRATPAARGGLAWYKGDFHSHTVHSDGYNSIDEYAVEAKRVGLDFLAITDHNTCSHFIEIAERPDDGLLLIPGEEVTTGWGHANVWGLDGWVDFRCEDDAGMQRILDSVHERGGLFSPNHPKVGYPWEFAGVRGYRVCETWQGPWRLHNDESLDFWERRLRAGERVVAVGGSDCHSIPPAKHLHPWTLGDPCTWVRAENLGEEAVLDAVRAGHVFVSEDPTGPFLELTATCDRRSYQMGDAIAAPEGSAIELRLRYRGPAEKKLRLLRDGELWREAVADGEDVELAFELPLDAPGYVRAEVAGYRGRPERGEVVHALTNPLYLEPQT